MKLRELNEALKKKKKPKKPKKRPNKDLWFRDKALWNLDLQREMGGLYDVVTSEDEEDTDLFATDPGQSQCYGVWRGKLGRGITFKKPRPLHTIAHPRLSLSTYLDKDNELPKQNFSAMM